VLDVAREQGLEGIVAKRIDAAYESGQRSGAWVKYKTSQSQELVVGGYLPGPDGFESLLVGYYEKGRLLFAGKVRNGFVPALRRQISERFAELAAKDCPFANLPEPKNARRGEALTKEVMKKCRWLAPELVAEIHITEWTRDKHLRHARFAGLRDDKDPREVVREAVA
jgi:bifunctional non-homologous end joining protein LigD